MKFDGTEDYRQLPDTLNPNDMLGVNGKIYSQNKTYMLMYGGDGNLTLSSGGHTTWSSNTRGTRAGVCIMQDDGNLVIYDPDWRYIWDSNTANNPGSRLIVQDDRNVVIYRPDGAYVWSTNTVYHPDAHGNVMQPEEVLRPGGDIRSAHYLFTYQRDGDLVLYGVGTSGSFSMQLWTSNTKGKSAGVCMMQSDGNLVIYGPNGNVHWHSGTPNHPGSRLLVEDNGRAVILDPNNQFVWSTNVLEIPFRFGAHNLNFPNPQTGSPDWSTFKETFGAVEVWHELVDPVFGHPRLTFAYYGFYCYFLKGKPNGGLATGFCTSVASLVADNLWQGKTDTPTIKEETVKKKLTAVHGKLLSRESLIHFHDQSREGIARVEKTYREIEATFLRGVNRRNAPLLFFIPSGAIWDGPRAYGEKLNRSHCVMPYRFVYPTNHSGPRLSADGSTTTTDPDRVEMYVWDCNNPEPTNYPEATNCKLVFSRGVGGRIEYKYWDGGTEPKFTSQEGFTLGMMTNGQYMLSNHSLPFSGPYGVTRFVIDFVFSPVELQITNASGLRTGNFGGKVYSEIPGSHPCYLVKGAYLLPENTALTRRIVGLGAGTYDYNSITPNKTSVTISGVSIATGQEDILSISSDVTQIRFAPAVKKTFSITLAREVGDQVRAIAIIGAGAGPGEHADITVSPEMSVLHTVNRGTARSVNVKALAIAKSTNTSVNKEITGISIPANHDLAVTIRDWTAMNLQAQAIVIQGQEYRIVNKNSGKCLDVAGASVQDQALVQQYTCHGGNNQRWLLQQIQGQEYRIVNKNSGKCLDVAGASTADQAKVQQYTSHVGNNQRWLVEHVEGQEYKIRNKNSGKCLDVAGASVQDQALVQQYTCHGGNNQRWNLIV